MNRNVLLTTIINKKDMSKVLYIKKEYEKIQCIYNIYYEEEGYIYKYDVLEKIITKMNSKKVVEDLATIFNLTLNKNKQLN